MILKTIILNYLLFEIGLYHNDYYRIKNSVVILCCSTMFMYLYGLSTDFDVKYHFLLWEIYIVLLLHWNPH